MRFGMRIDLVRRATGIHAYNRSNRISCSVRDDRRHSKRKRRAECSVGACTLVRIGLNQEAIYNTDAGAARF